jgi:peptidoglycan-associated lipoprotein
MRTLKVVLFGVVVAASACGAKDKKEDTTPMAQTAPKQADTSAQKPQEPVKADITPADPGATPPSDPIYFDFDSSNIADNARGTLQKVGDYLMKHPGSMVTVSGNTDDRGTTEYNLALGDQRAKAARDYLVRMGVDPARIKTISYGKEKPAVTGGGEEAWGKNRRDEFETKNK